MLSKREKTFNQISKYARLPLVTQQDDTTKEELHKNYDDNNTYPSQQLNVNIENLKNYTKYDENLKIMMMIKSNVLYN